MKQFLRVISILCICSLCIGLCSCDTPTESGEPETLPYAGETTIGFQNQTLETFQYLGVELLDSQFKDNYDTSLEYLLSIPNDDILKKVRERAGVDAPGTDLGGWESGGHTVGETFGQWLSTLARAYRTTKDERYKEKALTLMDGWAACIEEDGFFYPNPNRSSQFWNYTYDKMVLGLTDVYVYIGEEKALQYLSTITDYYMKKPKDQRRLPTSDNFVGEFRTGIGDQEWYTLSENLYRAYLVTGDEKYKTFAQTWHYEPFWDALRNQQNDYWKSLHAYSHVNSVGGAALAYMVTGDEKYKGTITGFYDAFTKYEFMPNGAYGVGEGLQGNYNSLQTSARNNNYSFETPCCSWAGMKLSQYLLTITGDASYGDWTEKLLYNGIMATLPMQDSPGKRGETFYYADYTDLDAIKDFHPASFPCCSGTWALTYTAIPDHIYYKDNNSLYVNLYVPSKVTNLYNDRLVTVTQTTEYPTENQVNFSISCTNKVQVDLKIRVPSWVNGTVGVTINGKAKQVEAKAGEWLSLGTDWKNGDSITVTFPLEVSAQKLEDKNGSAYMFMYGPVMLVAENAATSAIALDANQSVEEFFAKAQSDATFQITDKDGKTFTFKPFYQIQKGVKYNSFFDIAVRN